MVAVLAGSRQAAAAERVYFPAYENVTDVLVARIMAETERIDISSWYLSEHAVSIALANRFAAGVPIRLMGDRGAIFEADAHTKTEFYFLANLGIPIRLRVHPNWFPEINHWKMALFKKQGLVVFGSGNFAPTELAPVNATNYSDETILFSDDPALVGAFKTRFDVMWNDTTPEAGSRFGTGPYFKDWYDACATEWTGNCADFATLYPNPAPMIVNPARLEGDNPTPPDLIWGQGQEFNDRIVQEINNEFTRVDLLTYRLETDDITNAILAKHQAGIPVRVIIDRVQYTNIIWPEYWLTHANIDKLWAAGVPIRQNNHDGVMHMKTLVTSAYASNASSNIGPNWQRDHNYFVPKATKTALYQSIATRADQMWNDTAGFGPLVLTPPRAADLSSPATGATGVATNVTLVWNRAAWAVSYDVYLGTSQANMTLVANVPAQMVTDPPLTYSWTAPAPLQGATTYFWKVVSRTNATPLAPNMIATSSTWSFSTAGTVGPPAAPSSPTPSAGATGVSTQPALGWSAGAAGTTFNVAFGTSNPPPAAVTGLTSPSYSPGTLSANTTYFWKVTAVSSGGSTAGPVWSFTTGAAPGALPAPWQNRDVGSTGLAGSASYSGGTFSVRGAGADIWGSTDGFQYVYQPLTGDGQIVVQVTGITNTSTFAKAGVMWRESTAAGAAHVILDVRPTGDIEFMSRAATGGETSYIAGATQANWLKLTRSGTTFTGYVSTDGSTWALVGTTTASIPNAAFVGMIATSHDTSQLNTSTFAGVSVQTATPPAPPTAPASPSPANGATGISTTPTLTWSSTGATSYDVKFGVANPPPQVATGQAAASFAPGTLLNNKQYFWQIVARNSSGTTSGPVWSFTTLAVQTAPEIVIYASDIPSANLRGSWSVASDPTSPNGVKLITTDSGAPTIDPPMAAPMHYVDVTFNAAAGTPYRLWLRIRALGDSKWNDSLWVQFSDALSGGSSIYPMNTTSGLNVNLATDAAAGSLNNWGWQNTAYWLSQPTTVTFASSGTHTMRIQVREDGVQLDQIVLSSSQYLSAAPGGPTNDTTIVSKP